MFTLYFKDNFSLRTYLNIKNKIKVRRGVFTNHEILTIIPFWAPYYLLITLDKNKNYMMKSSSDKKYNLDDSKVDSILSVLKLIFSRYDFNMYEKNLQIDGIDHKVSLLYVIVRIFIRRLFPANYENDEKDKKNFNSCLPTTITEEKKTSLFNKIKDGGFTFFPYTSKFINYIKKNSEEEELLQVFNGFKEIYKEKEKNREDIDYSAKRMLIVFRLFLVAKRILKQDDADFKQDDAHFPEPKEPERTLTKIGNLFKNKTTNQTSQQENPKTPQTSIGNSVSNPLKPIQTTNQPLPKTTQTSFGNSVSNPLKPKEPEKPKIGKSVFTFKRPWRGGKNKTKRNIDRSKKSNKTLKNKTRR
jgi:hypothetical protein